MVLGSVVSWRSLMHIDSVEQADPAVLTIQALLKRRYSDLKL